MRAFFIACLTLASVTAHAADPTFTEAPVETEPRDIIFDLGGGVGVSPRFPSSRIYDVRPFPLFDMKFLRLPVFGEVVTEKVRTVSVYPSLNFVGRRDDDDAAYLRGIPDREFSVEAGAGVAVEYGPVRGFAELRYGVVGHNAFVGEVGVDITTTPMERLEFIFGPRLGFGDSRYMDTYFGVPASAITLPAYDAGGFSIKDVGIAAEAIYTLTEKWRLHGRARYSHFVGNALDSPIVDAGNDQEFMVGIGLSYRFGVDLY